ncbi:hypothetical protein ABZZ74_37710 [Streptomyces sp. NPDC006476]|uniref:hypothetical protein n=1 Tax=Streptomyces sp. NPDC006476 TaxID=3157175 RepID=UPI0033A13CDE
MADRDVTPEGVQIGFHADGHHPHSDGRLPQPRHRLGPLDRLDNMAAAVDYYRSHPDHALDLIKTGS